MTRKVEASLKRLGLDYVDIFHFHAVGPESYTHHRDVLAPALLKLKEQGKVRHIGVTETGPRDPEQKMLAKAIQEAPWEVIMLAYSLVNQGARRRIFPVTLRRGIGTLLMFVVRNIFSNDAYRRDSSPSWSNRASSMRRCFPRAIHSRSWCPKAAREHHGCGLSLRAPRQGATSSCSAPAIKIM